MPEDRIDSGLVPHPRHVLLGNVLFTKGSRLQPTPRKVDRLSARHPEHGATSRAECASPRPLGREMALAAAAEGARICITGSVASETFDQTADDVCALVGADNLLACVSDVTDKGDVEDVVAQCVGRFGRIDVLVNNAGRGMRLVSERFNVEPTKFWLADVDAWNQIIDTNINGPFLMASAVIPGMIETGFGKIINVSTSAQTMVRQGYSPYGPSKAFLEAASRAWAVELAGMGIDVNVLLPGGAADTDLLPPSPDKKGADGNLLPADIMS